MTEDFDRLEAELARMRPAPAPRALVRRIGRDLGEPTPAANRLLGASVVAGALAAAVIVGIVVGEPAAPGRAPDVPAVADAPLPPVPRPPGRDLSQAFVVARMDEPR